MKKIIIKLENVWKIYKMGEVEVEALRGLNLEIKRNEFVAVQGPSGSGKSTAVNMIGCLDVPTRGKILLEGEDISKLSESDLAQIRGQKIGFVFQQFNLIPTLSALQNVTLPMIFQKTTSEQRINRAKDILRMVDLGDRMEHKPSEMSGGEQQRVAIARALANDPDVLLADEPTGNLDSKTGKEIMDFLLRLHNTGKTIIMVTHDDKLAHFAERIEFLQDGRIKEVKKGKKHRH